MEKEEMDKLLEKIKIVCDWFSECVGWYTISNQRALDLIDRLDEAKNGKK